MNAATLRKSLRAAVEELEEPLDDILQKANDAEEDDDDDWDDDEDDVVLNKADDYDDEDDEDDEEEDEEDGDEAILRKARKILKARHGKKGKKAKMSDDDYTDDDMEDDEDDDDDMDDMDKAILMDNEEVSRDKAVLRYGRGMKTIIFMRKSLEKQGDMLKSLRRELKTQAKVQHGSLQLLHKIGQLVVNGAELTKSIHDDIDEIGNRPERTKTVRKSRKTTRSSRDSDFQNPRNAAEVNEMLEKSMKAVRDHKLDERLVPMLETRLRSLPGNPDIDLFDGNGGHMSDQWLQLKGYLQQAS